MLTSVVKRLKVNRAPEELTVTLNTGTSYSEDQEEGKRKLGEGREKRGKAKIGGKCAREGKRAEAREGGR